MSGEESNAYFRMISSTLSLLSMCLVSEGAQRDRRGERREKPKQEWRREGDVEKRMGTGEEGGGETGRSGWRGEVEKRWSGRF
jgi:hypothetical protein